MRKEPIRADDTAAEHYTLLIRMPEDAVCDEQGRWQPTRITAREGWREITGWMRAVYLGFVAILLGCDLHYLRILPAQMQLPTWFGMSSVRLPTAGYMLGSVALLLYLIYRDLIRRSISRYRLFVPLAAVVMNSYFISSCIAG